MKVIFKYPLYIIDYQEIVVPVGAEILTIQAQKDNPCLWCLVDNDTEEKVVKNIHIIGTGNPIYKESLKYINTFQIQEGNLIFHAFEAV